MNETKKSSDEAAISGERNAVSEYERACMGVLTAAQRVRDARSKRTNRPPLEDALRALEEAVDAMNALRTQPHVVRASGASE
jgi:hypothetical protein